eukprot:TRINITY_DN3746_c0_g1_i1.p1 TRINITY_DN3746_c0_g1~~TRINITY_DN3746_c0_g1_i1.p1  ORF type:complete len:457 (-),score=128.36 TRINITY_DN3746_c0_g1_i1:24-1394(-)
MKNQGTNKRNRKKNKGILIELAPVAGTRDFVPEDMRLRNWLFGHMRDVARLFSFEEYDVPILEEQQMYQRKSGEEITEQMYCFEAQDKSLLALRPEMTPSLARLIMKEGRKRLMPIRWYSIPQCWRYETVQRGRKREHYQWNMDIWGVTAVTAEIELIAAAVEFFKRVGITSEDVGFKVNSRKVLQTVLEPLGITGANFAPVCVIIDKLEKIGPEEVSNQLETLGIEGSVITKITQTLAISSLDELEQAIPDSKVVQELKKFWDLAEGYGIADWIQFDASVVRGLAYYTGIVFEAFDRAGELRAICGGGRYDKLLSIYGAKQDIAACGFGFGDCVIIELLADRGLIPTFESETDDLIVPFNEDLRPAACQVAAVLRSAGRRVNVQLIPRKKVAWCYNYADRVGAERVIFVAPEEWERDPHEVRIKYLRLGDEYEKEIDVALDILGTDEEPQPKLIE